MPHQSPFTESIYSEWERLILAPNRVLDDGRTPHPDQIAGWRALDAKAKQAGCWCVPAPDASLIASLGVTIALQERRFEDAARLAQEYLEHPDAETGDAVAWETMSIRAGIATIRSGRVDEGIRRLDEILADEFRTTRGCRLSMRNDLIYTFEDLGTGVSPDPRLSALTARLLDGWGPAERARAARTHGELVESLNATYAR